MHQQQFSLNLHLQDEAKLDNFYPADATQRAILNYLTLFCHGQVDNFVHLYGSCGTGRSHLLQACCQKALLLGKNSFYLSASELLPLDANLLQDFEQCELLIIDDIELLLSHLDWQESLLHLYNRLDMQGHRLLISTRGKLASLTCSLPDLHSRLQTAMSFQLQKLDDIGKLAALQLRAKLRGMQLTKAVGRYILHHHPRNMHDLMHLLTQLDKLSLTNQHKLTIPFVKQVLNKPITRVAP